MKLKVYVIDFEIPARVKKWGIRMGILALLLGSAAVAIAAGPLHVWATGDTLQATDLNGNFSNLQAQITSTWTLSGTSLYNNTSGVLVGIGTATPSAALDVNGQIIRKIARAHGNGPNDATANGAIASRLLAYSKTQTATGLRVTWNDNLRCDGANVSCAWEIKVDGASCAMPGPLVYDVYNGDSSANTNVMNFLLPGAHVGTCFGISAGPHTIQVYATAPAPNPTGGAGATAAGTPYTGWNAAYWSIEAEEVY